MTWGGLWGDSLKRGVDSKFQQQHGVEVVQDRGSSPVERIAKIRVNAGNQLFDLIMTGTPEGVGPVKRGEVMTGGIDGIGAIKISVR